MAWINSKIKIFGSRIQAINDAAKRSLEKTGEALHTEIVQAQVMPRDTGHLQNDSTFVDYSQSSRGVVTIVSSTPYARRLYFHPEYNFRKVENPNAQGKWFDPWISGKEKDFCRNAFAAFMKQEGGG